MNERDTYPQRSRHLICFSAIFEGSVVDNITLKKSLYEDISAPIAVRYYGAAFS